MDKTGWILDKTTKNNNYCQIIIDCKLVGAQSRCQAKILTDACTLNGNGKCLVSDLKNQGPVDKTCKRFFVDLRGEI